MRRYDRNAVNGSVSAKFGVLAFSPQVIKMIAVVVDVAMKLIIYRNRNTDDEARIVRYGVRDFQINFEDNSVTLFYGHEQRAHANAPDEETISGTVAAAEDSFGFDEDEVYPFDDIMHERDAADDLRDYRASPPNPDAE